MASLGIEPVYTIKACKDFLWTYKSPLFIATSQHTKHPALIYYKLMRWQILKPKLNILHALCIYNTARLYLPISIRIKGNLLSCWICTNPVTHCSQGIHLSATWALFCCLLISVSLLFGTMRIPHQRGCASIRASSWDSLGHCSRRPQSRKLRRELQIYPAQMAQSYQSFACQSARLIKTLSSPQLMAGLCSRNGTRTDVSKFVKAAGWLLWLRCLLKDYSIYIPTDLPCQIW